MSLRFALISSLCLVISHAAFAQAVKTQVIQKDGKWQLIRDSKPFFIKGIGGDASRKIAADLGANSFRTWGPEELDVKLAEAQKLGLTVTVGIWLGHERHGFNYNDAAKVAAQLEKARQVILKYKDHPSVLMWAIGNEMEGYKAGDNPLIWAAVNDIAAMAKKLDPNHPTMTVVAELGGQRVQCIHKLCPSIDIVGINTYAGCVSIPARYKAAGGTKPYVITEFGPAGTWETAKNTYGALPELTSTAKGAVYKKAYEGAISSQAGLCLGSYVFTWGNKQEKTATWFGMLLPDGARLEAVDVMGELWSGKPPVNRVPKIQPLSVQGGDTGSPGETKIATVKVTDPENDPIKVTWELHREANETAEGGDFEAATPQFPESIISSSNDRIELKLPEKPGIYRLYAFARDNHNGGAMANVTLLVKAKSTDPATASPPVTTPVANTNLPLVIYSDDQKAPPFAPSGWMGNNKAIALDPVSKDQPHTGATCMKLTYKAADNFGGVVWQDPPDDWGDKDGGKDLSGAKKLTFWARGAKGGEKVEFKFGVLEKEKTFHDSDNGAITVDLTTDWQEYSIDLEGKDLSKIKTGFCWVLAGQGDPVTFYLDDISYQP